MLLNRTMLGTCAAALAVVGCLFAAPAARAEGVAFQGEVRRGEEFAHGFSHAGVALEFRLLPQSHGWQIWIGDPAHDDENFVALATPPFRGINAAIIEGWHFRNADNSGPNHPGPGNVNAPQEERGFAFFANAVNHRAAAGALDVILWPAGHTAGEIEAAQERLAHITIATGLLRIDALTLGNLVANQLAWVEQMTFTVTLELSDAK